jgi:hypothetical protein
VPRPERKREKIRRQSIVLCVGGVGVRGDHAAFQLSRKIAFVTRGEPRKATPHLADQKIDCALCQRIRKRRLLDETDCGGDQVHLAPPDVSLGKPFGGAGQKALTRRW